jgi:hypothetical protein
MSTCATSGVIDRTILSDAPGHPNNGDRSLSASLLQREDGFQFDYKFESRVLGEADQCGSVSAASLAKLKSAILSIEVPFFASHREYSGERGDCMTLRGLAEWYMENIPSA